MHVVMQRADRPSDRLTVAMHLFAPLPGLKHHLAVFFQHNHRLKYESALARTVSHAKFWSQTRFRKTQQPCRAGSCVTTLSGSSTHLTTLIGQPTSWVTPLALHPGLHLCAMGRSELTSDTLSTGTDISASPLVC